MRAKLGDAPLQIAQTLIIMSHFAVSCMHIT